MTKNSKINSRKEKKKKQKKQLKNLLNGLNTTKMLKLKNLLPNKKNQKKFINQLLPEFTKKLEEPPELEVCPVECPETLIPLNSNKEVLEEPDKDLLLMMLIDNIFSTN